MLDWLVLLSVVLNVVVIGVSLWLLRRMRRLHQYFTHLANSSFQGFLVVHDDQVVFQNKLAVEICGELLRQPLPDWLRNCAPGDHEVAVGGKWFNVHEECAQGNTYLLFVDVTARKQLVAQYQHAVGIILEH